MTTKKLLISSGKISACPGTTSRTADSFKAGNPEIAVRGIACTCMATFDLIQRAHAAGMNMVVTHEPTWWSDRDSTDSLLNDAVYNQKTEYCLKNDMEVIETCLLYTSDAADE